MLSIGDFALHGQVSVRMLRHYDALGLLEPVHVDPSSGYRRYAAEQLSRLNRLIALKELGFTLEQIGPILDASVSADNLIDQAEALGYDPDASTIAWYGDGGDPMEIAACIPQTEGLPLLPGTEHVELEAVPAPSPSSTGATWRPSGHVAGAAAVCRRARSVQHRPLPRGLHRDADGSPGRLGDRAAAASHCLSVTPTNATAEPESRRLRWRSDRCPRRVRG
ncbi:MerR family transcriptional regulator [Nostocoides australiense]